MDKFFKLPAGILAITSLLMLILLSGYSYYHEKDFFKELNDRIANPQKNQGKNVYLSYVKIISLNNNEAVAKNRRGDIYRIFPTENIKQDEYYSFVVKIVPDGKLEIIQYYHQARWELKHLLSLLSLVLVLYYSFKYIRFDKNVHLLYIPSRKVNA
jgi:hypothetical protein